MTMFERFFVLTCYWHMNMYLYISPSTLPHWVVCISHCVCILSLIEHLIVKYIVTWICSISSRHQPQGHNNGWWFLMNVLNYNLLANQAVCDHNMQTIYHQGFLKDIRKKETLCVALQFDSTLFLQDYNPGQNIQNKNFPARGFKINNQWRYLISRQVLCCCRIIMLEDLIWEGGIIDSTKMETWQIFFSYVCKGKKFKELFTLLKWNSCLC